MRWAIIASSVTIAAYTPPVSKTKTTKVKKSRKKGKRNNKNSINEPTPKRDGNMKTPDNDQIENGIYKNPFQPPQFPGGASKLTDFINQNLNYPPTAKAKGIQGEVIVQLVVKENGFVGEMKILRSVDDDLDNEALRVCRMLPHFFPAKTATGKRVRTFYNVPVTFKLQETN